MEQHEQARPVTLAERLDPDTVKRVWAKVVDRREKLAELTNS